jgi:hypothetical protein
MSEPVFWTCDDNAENLCHTDVDEAVDEFLDNFFELREPAAAGMDRMPETITVYGFSRMKLGANEPDADLIVERILEDLDEEMGDPDGGFQPFDAEGEAAVKEKALALVAEIRARYRAWACEQTTTVEVNVKAWIAENHPEWLEGEP